jgi:hypothetical protein
MKPHVALLIPLLCVTPVLGHFVYVAPSENGEEIQVVLSETPLPDQNVAADKIAGTLLIAIDAAGKQTRLEVEKSAHCLTAKLPAGTVFVSGVTQYGVANSKHTGNIPVHIKYFSKAVLGDPSRASQPRLGNNVPLEIVPIVANGKLRFVATSGGKPVADADCVVKTPGDDKGERTKTTTDGSVPGSFEKSGRYGVWVRTVDLSPGELEGTRYDKTHIYATLVVDFPGR